MLAAFWLQTLPHLKAKASAGSGFVHLAVQEFSVRLHVELAAGREAYQSPCRMVALLLDPNPCALRPSQTALLP